MIRPFSEQGTVELKENVYRLRDGIVLSAVGDYRDVLKKLQDPKYKKHKENLEIEKDSLERFFLGNWFMMLTDINGEFLLREFRKEQNYVEH